jgi:hypothetical protein
MVADSGMSQTGSNSRVQIGLKLAAISSFFSGLRIASIFWPAVLPHEEQQV